jgi:hypothetical protein
MPSSSPFSSLTPVPSGTKGATLQCREVQETPHELIQHLQSYYEEDLNSQGLDLLYSITSNSVSSSNVRAPVSVPPPSHIALAATLAVHPHTTTRTEDRAKLAQSTSALKLLRLLYSVAGPNPPFDEAFRFRKFQDNFFHVPTRAKRDVYAQIETRHQYTEANSLFARAEDFWALMGWALNCSCLLDMYAERWKVYEPLLSLMVDILEADYIRQHEKETWEESIFWSYIELASGGSGRSRRIFRALFADGSSRNLNEFRAIFNNELRRPTQKVEEVVKHEIDLENDEFADYGKVSSDDSPDEGGDRPAKRARLRSRTRTQSLKGSNESLNGAYQADGDRRTLGPPEAIRLRTRLLRLLAAVATQPSLIAHSSTSFVAEDELYTLFVEFVKPLPIPMFQQIILPNTSGNASFDAYTHVRMCEAILERTLESRAPRSDDADLTAARLIQHFLPYAASGTSVDAQLRVALLIEALTRAAQKAGTLQQGADMGVIQWAVETGVLQRQKLAIEARTSGRKSKKNNTDDDEAWRMLLECGDRMRAIVGMSE